MLIYQTMPPKADTHNPQMKEIKKKGVATSLVPSATCWPLASLVLSVGTCSPSARVQSSDVRFSEKHLTLSFALLFTLPTTHSATFFERCVKPGMSYVEPGNVVKSSA